MLDTDAVVAVLTALTRAAPPGQRVAEATVRDWLAMLPVGQIRYALRHLASQGLIHTATDGQGDRTYACVVPASDAPLVDRLPSLIAVLLRASVPPTLQVLLRALPGTTTARMLEALGQALELGTLWADRHAPYRRFYPKEMPANLAPFSVRLVATAAVWWGEHGDIFPLTLAPPLLFPGDVWSTESLDALQRRRRMSVVLNPYGAFAAVPEMAQAPRDAFTGALHQFVVAWSEVTGGGVIPEAIAAIALEDTYRLRQRRSFVLLQSAGLIRWTALGYMGASPSGGR